MASLISSLDKTERKQLFDNLNYLHVKELRIFCDRHAIPYTIWVETGSGEKKSTSDTDRKAIVLNRIRHYLKTGTVLGKTCFSAEVVNFEDPPKILTSADRLYYGWYNKKNKTIMDLLKRLTEGKFKDGAIARILMRDFWTNDKAPTFAEFANAWLKINEKGLGPHPEAAWLTDRARNKAGKNWKEKRKKKAKKVFEILNSIKEF